MLCWGRRSGERERENGGGKTKLNTSVFSVWLCVKKKKTQLRWTEVATIPAPWKKFSEISKAVALAWSRPSLKVKLSFSVPAFPSLFPPPLFRPHFFSRFEAVFSRVCFVKASLISLFKVVGFLLFAFSRGFFFFWFNFWQRLKFFISSAILVSSALPFSSLLFQIVCVVFF